MADASRAGSFLFQEPTHSLGPQCLQIASMVCAASLSFVHSGVDLLDIFVEELAYKAAPQPHDVVLLYSAVAAPFCRPLLRKSIHFEQIRYPSGQACTLAKTSCIAQRLILTF